MKNMKIGTAIWVCLLLSFFFGTSAKAEEKREQQADPYCSSYFHVLHDINELVNNRMAKIDRKQ